MNHFLVTLWKLFGYIQPPSTTHRWGASLEKAFLIAITSFLFSDSKTFITDVVSRCNMYVQGKDSELNEKSHSASPPAARVLILCQENKIHLEANGPKISF